MDKILRVGMVLGGQLGQHRRALEMAQRAEVGLAGRRRERVALEMDAQQRDARASWKLLEVTRQADLEYTPPPLDADPLALALGLVPDPERRLSGSRLKKARMKRRLQASQKLCGHAGSFREGRGETR